ADDLVTTAERLRGHAPSDVSRLPENNDLHDFNLLSRLELDACKQRDYNRLQKRDSRPSPGRAGASELSNHLLQGDRAELRAHRVLGLGEDLSQRPLDPHTDRALRVRTRMNGEDTAFVLDRPVDVEQGDLGQRPRQPGAGDALLRPDQPGAPQHPGDAAYDDGVDAN